MRGSKTIKYIFFALLPLFLILMLFSYNSKPFMGAKCSASSSTNTITFYDDNNTIINSYSVPSGQSINDQTRNVTEDYSSSIFTSASRPAVTSSSDAIVFNSDYTRFAINGYASSTTTGLGTSRSGKINSNFTTSVGVILDIPDNLTVSRVKFNLDYASSLTLSSLSNCDLYIYNFDENYNYIGRFFLDSFSSSSGSLTINKLYSTITSGYYFLCAEFNYRLAGNTLVNSKFEFGIYITSSNITGVIDNSYSLASVINQDLYTAYTNGRLKNYENNNYSWSSLSNYNTDFTYDNYIYYDTNLYLVQKEKIFDFSKGAFDILGTLSNQTFYTDTALNELMQNFSSFSQISFNGDIIDVLKAIGLSILNVFKIILTLFKLLVYPIVDLIGIITLLITKSNAFWRFI